MQLSILIRNLNQAAQLEKTLQAILLQQVDFAYEIVLVDNESDDQSVEVARKFNCSVVNLPRKDFSYGKALNIGIAQCRGELILLLSAHVMLMGDDFLQRIPRYFSDHDVAFVRPVNIRRSHEVAASMQVGKIHAPASASGDEFLQFAAQSWQHMLIANCSVVRRSVAIEVPFNEVIEANEDKLWTLEVLRKGYAGLYHVPLYFLYFKGLGNRQRFDVDLKELKTKSEILGTGPYKGARIAFLLRSALYAFRAHMPIMVNEIRMAWKTSSLTKMHKSKYLQ
jgi:glycosyltransferase involved in cell wall biosynthesis